MIVVERERDSWGQVDRNYGVIGGWLYACITKTGPAWLTGWFERYFDEHD